MEKSIHNREYGRRFDYYKWSAPFFYTPQEIVRYIASVDLKEKKISAINTIGYVDTSVHSGVLYQKITEAGICLDGDSDWMKTYPHLDNVLIPSSVNLQEPIQFIFDDGTTLEILPIANGVARIGVNSIPMTISDGLNRSNFNANLFFKEIIGEKIESFTMRIVQSDEVIISVNSLQTEKPWTKTNYEYHFEFCLGGLNKIILTQSWKNAYTVTYKSNHYKKSLVPYKRLTDSVNEVEEIVIGRGWRGAVFWIVPIDLETEKENWEMNGYGITIYEEDVDEFLRGFLYQYYEASIQSQQDEEFQWYGPNFFTFDAMKRMIEDIRLTIYLLQNEYDHLLLWPIKNNFAWYQHTDKTRSELTDVEIDELRKKRVPLAVDFYERFCLQIENMMSLTDKNGIVFDGP